MLIFLLICAFVLSYRNIIYFTFQYLTLHICLLLLLTLLSTDGATSVYTYTNIWDANKIFGCDCDGRYYGSDCSLRNCPLGDDPLTGEKFGKWRR